MKVTRYVSLLVIDCQVGRAGRFIDTCPTDCIIVTGLQSDAPEDGRKSVRP